MTDDPKDDPIVNPDPDPDDPEDEDDEPDTDGQLPAVVFGEPEE